MSYEQKYLKYKQKYLALKNKLQSNLQTGGGYDDILDIDSLTDTAIENQTGGVAPFGHMSLHAPKDVHANIDGMVAPALSTSLYGKSDFSNTSLTMKAEPGIHASISKNIKMKVPIVTGPEPSAANMNETAGPIADVKPYSQDDPTNNDTAGKLTTDPDVAPPQAPEPVAPEPTPLDEITTLTESEKKPDTAETQKNISDNKINEGTLGKPVVKAETSDAKLTTETPVSESPVSSDADLSPTSAEPQTGGYNLSEVENLYDQLDSESESLSESENSSEMSDDSLSSISSLSSN
jgi:hypothetical protein